MDYKLKSFRQFNKILSLDEMKIFSGNLHRDIHFVIS